ncbi:hypothetical protein [Clostridium magnum]|uniref:Uncharacterized protein n=1 Tax=Clostridium magnum DSM 2767 TaxID=1121326 RepID=A0A168DYV4_9CLOT|nr:hypothetical protein [Clostridium magnum]KZL93453.1 hypothetical protein CLMAG_04990 [Clostridium magnum DSM 2767]SHI27603.1 hypothetical protein SAMN02745944_03898 [Clostridium magnum DSM 2767]
MSHRHCCCHDHEDRGNFLLPLAALIGLILLAFGRCRGTIYAVLVILSVLIVCGCGMKTKC